MSELNEAVDCSRRLANPEATAAGAGVYHSTQRGALIQVQAAVSMLVLPGLARRMQLSREWLTPAEMKAQLAGILLAREIDSHGRPAVVLDFFIRPFVHAHRDTTSDVVPISFVRITSVT